MFNQITVCDALNNPDLTLMHNWTPVLDVDHMIQLLEMFPESQAPTNFTVLC
jgi:hypothetical protein